MSQLNEENTDQEVTTDVLDELVSSSEWTNAMAQQIGGQLGLTDEQAKQLTSVPEIRDTLLNAGNQIISNFSELSGEELESAVKGLSGEDLDKLFSSVIPTILEQVDSPAVYQALGDILGSEAVELLAKAAIDGIDMTDIADIIQWIYLRDSEGHVSDAGSILLSALFYALPIDVRSQLRGSINSGAIDLASIGGEALALLQGEIGGVVADLGLRLAVDLGLTTTKELAEIGWTPSNIPMLVKSDAGVYWYVIPLGTSYVAIAGSPVMGTPVVYARGKASKAEKKASSAIGNLLSKTPIVSSIYNYATSNGTRQEAYSALIDQVDRTQLLTGKALIDLFLNTIDAATKEQQTAQRRLNKILALRQRAEQDMLRDQELKAQEQKGIQEEGPGDSPGMLDFPAVSSNVISAALESVQVAEGEEVSPTTRAVPRLWKAVSGGISNSRDVE